MTVSAGAPISRIRVKTESRSTAQAPVQDSVAPPERLKRWISIKAERVQTKLQNVHRDASKFHNQLAAVRAARCELKSSNQTPVGLDRAVGSALRRDESIIQDFLSPVRQQLAKLQGRLQALESSYQRVQEEQEVNAQVLRDEASDDVIEMYACRMAIPGDEEAMERGVAGVVESTVNSLPGKPREGVAPPTLEAPWSIIDGRSGARKGIVTADSAGSDHVWHSFQVTAAEFTIAAQWLAGEATAEIQVASSDTELIAEASRIIDSEEADMP